VRHPPRGTNEIPNSKSHTSVTNSGVETALGQTDGLWQCSRSKLDTQQSQYKFVKISNLGFSDTETCRAKVKVKIQNHVTTIGQSVSMSWCRVRSGTCVQILFSVWNLLCYLWAAPSLMRGRVFLLAKVKIILRPTVSRPVRPGVRHPSGTRDQFLLFFLWLFLDSFGFVDVGRPLWREVGSVLSSFCWASSAQHFSEGIAPALYILARTTEKTPLPTFLLLQHVPIVWTAYRT
jgi:hypothetical protein